MAGLRLGVVADDVTGANDMGSMFARAGGLTHVYAYSGPGDLARQAHLPQPEVAILDTNSRLDARAAAYAKVHAATRELLAAGCQQFHNKTCSVFRGNIGAEFDAMLDALEADFAVVVVGFPKNGRTTFAGTHFVHGQRLEDSAFRHDPIHPTTRSNLVDILQAQTQRRVGLVDHTVIRQGPAALSERLNELRGQLNYVILDVPDQAALGTIAAAVHTERILCGSSAIGEELPRFWPPVPAPAAPVVVPPVPPGLGGLVIAGSLTPQTRTQLDYLAQQGAVLLPLDTAALLDDAANGAGVARVVEAAAAAMQIGRDAVIHSVHAPEVIAATKAAGAAQGLSTSELGRRISAGLAEATARTLAATGHNRLVVAGGETSAAICARLGVTALRVWEELAPGLPSCLALNDARQLLVLKSGSFGGPAFLADALAYLKSK